MKELSIEEKARRYDEALERASNLHKDAVEMENNMTTKTCEIIFPELAESEDERIRKALIRFHKSTIDIDGIKGPDVIAWLEKQGEQNLIMAESPQLDEQKPAWSEEDEGMLDKVIKRLHKYSASDEGYLDKYYWLKSLKNKVQLQPKQEWSEEDDKNLERTIWYVEKGGKLIFAKTDKLVSWLKSLKEKLQPQPKQEWSEEDEEELKIALNTLEKAGQYSSAKWLKNVCLVPQAMQKPWSEEDERNLQGIIDEIEANKNQAPDCDIETYDRFLNWLKSLRPQNRWKPSDEQIKAVRLARAFVTDDFGDNPTLSEILIELEKQLKAL